MKRTHQLILVASTLLGSWLCMQAIHEAGHMLAARLSGGTVENVALHPLSISRTDVGENPQPLIVVWAGPLFGGVAPLALWSIAALAKMPGAFVLRFFVGFCLIANGCYIGVGSFAQVGDCGEMLRHGSPIWTLWGFGALATPLGFWLWNGQGKHFGLGPEKQSVEARVAWATLAVAVILLIVGIVVGD